MQDAEISFEKSKINQGQKAYECRILSQKLGYDTQLLCACVRLGTYGMKEGRDVKRLERGQRRQEPTTIENQEVTDIRVNENPESESNRSGPFGRATSSPTTT